MKAGQRAAASAAQIPSSPTARVPGGHEAKPHQLEPLTPILQRLAQSLDSVRKVGGERKTEG